MPWRYLRRGFLAKGTTGGRCRVLERSPAPQGAAVSNRRRDQRGGAGAICLQPGGLRRRQGRGWKPPLLEGLERFVLARSGGATHFRRPSVRATNEPDQRDPADGEGGVVEQTPRI